MPHEPPKLALETLSIRDFRGIESLDLDFRGPDGLANRLVVIGGPNGCGKTTVLEAAIRLMDERQLILKMPRRREVRRGAKHYTIEGQFHDSLSNEPKLQLCLSTGNKLCLSTGNSRRSNQVPYIPIQYFPSWRTPGTGGPVNVTIDGPQSSELASERLRSVKQWLVNAAAVEKFSPKGSKHSNMYYNSMPISNQAWNELDPVGASAIQVELTDPDHEDGGSFDLFFRRAGLPRLEDDHLSSGQLELFLLVVDLIRQNMHGGVVFIDEPELHLDPQWHRPFLRSLMRLQPLTQFIVTTHSPEIFDSAYSYERHFLVPEDDPRAKIWPQKSIVSTGA